MTWMRTGSITLTLVATAIAGLGGTESLKADEPGVTRLAWRRSYKQAAEEARQRRRPILIKVTATWCGPCRQMQQLTFTDERVRRRLGRDFILLELDADEHSQVIADFRVEAFPTTLVVSPELNVIKRLKGFQSARDLVNVLEHVCPGKETDDAEDGDQPVSALSVANVTGLGFGGFCLTSLLDDNKLRRGDARWTTLYREQTVCFHSEEHLRKFLANPDRYWPVANGQCLVSSQDSGLAALGDPRVGVIWRGKLWFFSDRATQQRFLHSPHHYADRM